MGVASSNVFAFFDVGFPVCRVRLSFGMGGGAVMLGSYQILCVPC